MLFLFLTLKRQDFVQPKYGLDPEPEPDQIRNPNFSKVRTGAQTFPKSEPEPKKNSYSSTTLVVHDVADHCYD